MWNTEDVDTLILVDEQDREIGYEEKDACHILPTKLHRAFSVFIVNSRGEMLIHKRSGTKKTWPGYWTNACCSHPRWNEGLDEAVQRRLNEELGFSCPVTHLFSFRYEAVYDSGYGENEFDHVFLGVYDGPVYPDPAEISDYSFVSVEGLRIDAEEHPEEYTPWFLAAFPKVLSVVGSSPSDKP